MSAAWYTIAEIMPGLVVADPVAVPPVQAPTIRMSLTIYPDREPSSRQDIQIPGDVSSFQMASERQLACMEFDIYGPVYLSDGARTAKVTDALVHLLTYSGYKPIQ
jgi:hypothetical protein